MSLKIFAFLISIVLISACEKEHLQPDVPGQADPLVYFIGRIGTDSVRIAGGIDSYIGSTAVTDTDTNRVFSFLFENFDHPSRSSLEISINNYQEHLGNLQSDLDHSIFPGDRHYQDVHHFLPLAVTVKWLNAHGTEYTSRLASQSELLSILSVEDISNEGKDYKKTTVEFECNLKDDTGHTLHLANGRAVLLFGVD